MFAGAGTILNTATVLTGGGLGLTVGHRIPERVREALIAVLGIFVLVLGVKTALQPQVGGGGRPDLAVVLVALLVGTALGSWAAISGRLERLADRVTRGRGGARSGSVGQAFLSTSLLFCVGPLTVLGSFEDGGRGDILLLGIKSALDGVAALAFASTVGPGVLLSAGTVAVVQGLLTAAAYLTRGSLDPALVTAALGAGGLMLVGIGLRLLRLADLPVADMLPALVLAPLFQWVVRTLGWPV